MQKIGFCDKFSLTQAVLNGTKTMTRRLEKELDRLVSEYQMRYEEPIRIIEQKWDKGKNCLLLYAHTGIADTDREHVLTLNTRYKLGEVVAVAQSYRSIHDEMTNGDYGDSKYDAFRCAMVAGTKGWNNKLFVRPDLMPHQIQITGVRVERLQDITHEDCMCEGVLWDYDDYPLNRRKVYLINDYETFSSPREAFAALINRPGVGRKGLWESNPWVVVYEFKLVK